MSLEGGPIVFCGPPTQILNMKMFKLLIKLFLLATTAAATMVTGNVIQLNNGVRFETIVM